MRGWLSSFRLSAEERRARQEVALPKTKDTVASFPIVVFSHSYCPLCRRVKQVLTEQGATFKAIELDEESDGSAIHSALMKWTGQAACPNVFIGGKHVGGYNEKGNWYLCSSKQAPSPPPPPPQPQPPLID
ncbi:glutaredoxin-C6-like isoform X2 [Ananas comosus]|uniref:Glutaredoxin-C6-like isoform X2 n=1 Tax=Ananas comosus TaxID=4615 RepID=A0A6P5EMW1_ANACO|nr:glutaredoxin-C6-like isoform X2 [Ananas comosus]